MPALPNSKHERFAQLVAQGLSATKAYIEAGFSKNNADSNAARLSGNERISARIKEIQNRVAEGVIAQMTLDRSRRVALLEDSVARKLALRRYRAKLYGHEVGPTVEIWVADAAAEQQARADGFVDAPSEVLAKLKHDKKDRAKATSPETTPAQPPADTPASAPEQTQDFTLAPAEFPKLLHHPGHPVGGATGLLVKDYRGKSAEQEIWKMDTGTEDSIRNDLKQIAIETGDWDEKREPVPATPPPTKYNIVFVNALPRDLDGNIIREQAPTQASAQGPTPGPTTPAPPKLLAPPPDKPKPLRIRRDQQGRIVDLPPEPPPPPPRKKPPIA